MADLDPGAIVDRDGLRAALEELQRQAGSYQTIAERAELGVATVHDAVSGKTLPRRSTLRLMLRAYGVANVSDWERAYDRVTARKTPRPSGSVRVSDADPRLLGVRRAIQVTGGPLDFLPEYVERDVDLAHRVGLRARLRACGRTGGFLLVIGGSSAGKSRCLYEAVRQVLPDWWLVHPRDPGEIGELACSRPGQVVVWLDELQRYLSDESCIDPGVIRGLLQASAPVVVVGTLWPAYYERYTVRPAPGTLDLRERERAIVQLADVVTLEEKFTPAEADRAAQSSDPRVQKVLGYTDYGFTQAMAAAPQLIERWEHADPYARALVSVVLDAARLGVRSPIPAEVLRAAAPGYCDRRTRARADATWFDRALAFTSAELNGAVSMLAPVAGPDESMGEAAGYQVADYLLDKLGPTRGQAQVPEAFWKASCLLSPAAARRIGEAAQSRLRYGPAARLYARACEDVADVRAAERLARLYEKAGRYGDAADILLPSCYAHFDNALVHATAGVALALNMAQAGELGWLVAQADAGDDNAAEALADALAERGDEELLLARVRAGDDHAGDRLARMWRGTGCVAEAIELLRSFVGTEAMSAPSQLAEILVEQDRPAEAIEVLTQVAAAGHEIVNYRLAELLADAGRAADALLVLEGLMLQDDPSAQRLWVDILAGTDSEGTQALLREAAGQGNADAARELARLLAQDHRLDEAAEVLRMVGLTQSQQAELMQMTGRLDEAIEILRPLARIRDSYDSEKLAGLLAEAGARSELAARAEAGDGYAAVALARLWTAEGRAADATALLRATTASGSAIAANGWIEHLTSLGSAEDAGRLRRYGLTADGRIATTVTLPETRLKRRTVAARKYASQDAAIRYDPSTRPFWSPSDPLSF